MPMHEKVSEGWYWYMPAEHEPVFEESAQADGPVVMRVTADGWAIFPGGADGPWAFEDLDGEVLGRVAPPLRVA